MKKILLGTTGLVGAALLATAASAADAPKVTLGGTSDFQAGWVDNDAEDITGDADHATGMRNDNEVTVKVDGKTSGGLGYGAQVDIEADLSGDNDAQGVNASRTFTYLEGGWGRVELGGNKSAASTMRVDASTLAVATGGINGDWRHFVNPNGTTSSVDDSSGGSISEFITTSKLQMEHGGVDQIGDETTYNNTKVTYYTPRFSGFQAGVSYSPDSESKGQTAQRLEDVYSDVWEAGLGYEGTFSGVRFASALTGNWASDDSGSADDIEGWNVGALVGWQGFSVAGSYGDWGQGAFTTNATGVGTGTGTGTPATVPTNLADVEGNYWTAGAAYETGAFGVSLTYLDSEFTASSGDENTFNNLVLGADYKLAPGLTPYVEVASYEFDSLQDSDDNNDGTSVVVGTRVNY